MRCFCGSDYQPHELRTCPGFEVDAQGLSHPASILAAQCVFCGLVRHIDLPFATEEEYAAFYREKYPPTGRDYTAKNYESDRELARLRAEEYGIEAGERSLDVGSGSGAFVDECRSRGAEAYGCEIGAYAYRKEAEAYTYRKRLESIHFPTDHFDRVTAHDVVEHVLDPHGFLAEIHRITRQGGTAIIEIPDFFGEDGRKHWKKNEHLWYFTLDQFEQSLKKSGFTVEEISRPTPSKITFYARKLKERRPKILLPPGIGDSYWSIVKIQAFLKREKLGIPDVYVAIPKDRDFEAHKRAFPFIEMFPFLASSGVTVSAQDPASRKLWLEAYAQEGRTIFKDVLGMDYFIAYNGHLRVGRQMEELDPDLACDWFPPRFVSLEEERYLREAVERYERYLVFYFVFQGTYGHWTKEFPLRAVVNFIREAVERTGCTPVFAGARWDAQDASLTQVKQAIHGAVDLVGKTDVQQLFGLLRGAQAVVGYPSGLTIASAMLRQKTLVIWNDYYNRDFAQYAMPPEVRGVTYFAVNTKATGGLVGEVVKLAGEETAPQKKRSPRKPEPETIQPASPLAVICILADGGPFSVADVLRLRDRLQSHTTVPHRFCCLTNQEMPDGVEGLPLRKYAWSPKLELFREDLILDADRILYLDLDTEILANVDDLLIAEGDLLALAPWRRKNLRPTACASGMMGWKNDGSFNFIREQFRPDQAWRYRGDHEYIAQILEQEQRGVTYFQDLIPGMYSYRMSCTKEIPLDARIVCYHGHPRGVK